MTWSGIYGLSFSYVRMLMSIHEQRSRDMDEENNDQAFF